MSRIGTDKIGEIHGYHIYPLVIVADRYTGGYSGGKFTVWNTQPENIPDEIYADDNTCSYFWSAEADNCGIKYGVGNTIQEAVDDLYFKESNPWINIKDDIWWSLSSLKELVNDYIDPNFHRLSFTLDEARTAVNKYKCMKFEHDEHIKEDNDENQV